MDKATFQNIISTLEEVGVTAYEVCTGGDNTRMFNSETSIIYDTGTGVMIFSLVDNVGNLTTDANFDVAVLDYENIVSVKSFNLTYEQGLEFMDKKGYKDDERFQNLLKSNKRRSNNNPGVGGNLKVYTEEVPVLDEEGNPVKDENGNPVTKTEITLPKGMNHYII